MDYVLTMTTSGRRACFEATLGSFLARVRPLPSEVFVYDDGRKTNPGSFLSETYLLDGIPVVVAGGRRGVGFCRATGTCWKHAAETSRRFPWAFHLEDDFQFVRAVNLVDLAHVLSLEDDLVQMALMRDAVNPQERDAGGVVEANPDNFVLRAAGGQFPWLEHRSYFTTNPSLFRTSLPREFPWERGPNCEGKMTFRMHEVRPSIRFGAWGNGSPWVRHIGDRVGFGY